MGIIRKFDEFINEAKSERQIVQDLARHLSFDKEVIKYLNTSRAKRTEGWRELLQRKLRGHQLDYINYITKNMVADYNPQITGYLGMGPTGNDDEDETISGKYKGMSLKDIVRDIDDRVDDIEDVLGIDSEDKETVDKVKDKLKEIGYEPDWIEDEEDEDEE